MTAREGEHTLKEIYNLLKDRVLSYTRDNEQVVNEHGRMKDTLKKTVRKLSSASFSSKSVRRSSSADHIPESGDVDKTKGVNKMLEAHHLSISRKLAKTEATLSKVNDKLQKLEKRLVGHDKSVDDKVFDLLVEVRSSVNECRQVQTHTDGLVEKITDGVQQLLQNQQNVIHGSISEVQVPAELNLYCTKMQTQGQDIYMLGRALKIEDRVLQTIDQRYSDEEEDEKFQEVIREWAKKPKAVHIRDFVEACHMASGNMGKGKTLAPEEKDKLLQNVPYLCDNMLDVPLVLPHLVSKSVISPRLSEYVLAPSGRIERILRLVDVLCTKESGLKEFCDALKSSDQAHVAENMIEGGRVVHERVKRSASFSDVIEEREDVAGGIPSKDVMASDDDILRKIAQLLHERGII